MFGYIRPAVRRHAEEDSARFRAAYCALCHTLGRRYGFLAMFLLNYDFVLLAILLSLPREPGCAQRRCAVHPLKGCPAYEETEAMRTAADLSVILTWWQLQDHIADYAFVSGLKYRAAAFFLRRAYRKARSCSAAFDESVRLHLDELRRLERERCASLDAAAEPFAALLASMAEVEDDPARRRILHQLFYHLGRWIYLADAADDFSEDAKTGNYNPLRYRYGLDGGSLPEDVKRLLAETLDASIRRMAEAYALLDAGMWQGLLDGIFYESFYGIGKAVLDGTYHKAPRRRRFEKNREETA
ncbi:MAG: hypothetical protein E7425_01355 [Ruminococcaceae bacterium]|nr:hypothetical protein [Oscillospiraceae bacterium]